MHVLEKYIQENNTNPNQIAKLCDMSPSTVSRHIKGDRRIEAESAMKYHKALGIPLEQLLSIQDNSDNTTN